MLDRQLAEGVRPPLESPREHQLKRLLRNRREERERLELEARDAADGTLDKREAWRRDRRAAVAKRDQRLEQAEARHAEFTAQIEADFDRETT